MFDRMRLHPTLIGHQCGLLTQLTMVWLQWTCLKDGIDMYNIFIISNIYTIAYTIGNFLIRVQCRFAYKNNNYWWYQMQILSLSSPQSVSQSWWICFSCFLYSFKKLLTFSSFFRDLCIFKSSLLFYIIFWWIFFTSNMLYNLLFCFCFYCDI